MTATTPLVPAVVVVHGALGSARQMAPVVEALRALRRFADVVPVELPGHGETALAAGQPFDMTVLADALGEAIARAGITRPLVFGYSMGGYAALVRELRAPGTIGGVVTLGTMLHWTPAIAARAAARLDATLIREKVPAFAATLAERHQGAGGWDTVLAHTARLLRELGDAPVLTDETLALIHCPVHLLVGDRDDSVSLEETAHAASRLPHARASLLADTPHPIEKVDMALIAREVSDLAQRLSTGG
ncbi:alpha/beta fold hydrolase [Gemmatimonas sp.]|jgi:pimeloyl-ACP methyl ester carboxylesterase|uniref:alpha/beta fold hydrolase n=1 Tax=Gemmatimonas sp. TaxID=1962908 RepID=UPI0037C04ADB